MNIKGGVTSTKFAGAVDSINHLDAFIKTGDNEEILVQLEELKDFIENDKELSKYVKNPGSVIRKSYHIREAVTAYAQILWAIAE
jgi:hypothetical protein